MQIPVIAHRGQAKPYGSIPRINWGHPLTWGLVTYLYDAGCGPIELVTGGLRSITNATQTAAQKTTPFGSGLTYITGVGGTAAASVAMPVRNSLWTMASAAPYSFASGHFLTAAPTVQWFIFTTGDSTLTTAFGTGIDPTAGFAYVMGNSGMVTVAGTTSALLNKFTTCSSSVPSGTGNAYANGALIGTYAGAAASTLTAGATTINGMGGGASVAGNNFPVNGQVFYGAFWKGRLLSDAEHRKLHDDPWCFLIYPEDEMMADLVGGITAVKFRKTLSLYGSGAGKRQGTLS